MDLHTHTIASGHAYGTIRENAQAAADRKLQILGITEHGPGIPGTCDEFYFCNLRSIPRVLNGVEVYFGVEANVDNDGNILLNERWLKRLDYAIVGIHSFTFENRGREENTDALIKTMQHPKVHIISHPDDDHMPLNYERLVKAAKENHVALELNNSSLHKPQSRLNCYDNYRMMLKLAMDYGTYIVVDSDAHDPSAVGNFDLAIPLLEEVGFDESLLTNNDPQKFYELISSK